MNKQYFNIRIISEKELDKYLKKLKLKKYINTQTTLIELYKSYPKLLQFVEIHDHHYILNTFNSNKLNEYLKYNFMPSISLMSSLTWNLILAELYKTKKG